MNGAILLDTNVAIALLEGEQTPQRKLAEVNAAYLSVVALGELYFGAQRSGRVTANINRINDFAQTIEVVDCDQKTARLFGQLKAALFVRGRPIPDNDIWIAAIARQHGLVLATRDNHFNGIEHLTVETW